MRDVTKLLLLAGGAVILLAPKSARAKAASILGPQKLTRFSGRHDLYDRAYDQAYLPEPRRPDGMMRYRTILETPAEYYARLLPWQQSMLRTEMATATEWPVMKQYYYKAGKVEDKVYAEGPVGVSFYTADVPFVAWKLRNQKNKQLAMQGRLFVEITYPNGYICARVLDDGPSGLGFGVFDVSSVIEDAIRPHWPAFVKYKLIEGFSTDMMTMGERGISLNPDHQTIDNQRLPQPM